MGKPGFLAAQATRSLRVPQLLLYLPLNLISVQDAWPRRLAQLIDDLIRHSRQCQPGNGVLREFEVDMFDRNDRTLDQTRLQVNIVGHLLEEVIDEELARRRRRAMLYPAPHSLGQRETTTVVISKLLLQIDD